MPVRLDSVSASRVRDFVFGSSCILDTSIQTLTIISKSTEVQTLGELRMRGADNGRTRSLPRGESDKG